MKSEELARLELFMAELHAEPGDLFARVNKPYVKMVAAIQRIEIPAAPPTSLATRYQEQPGGDPFARVNEHYLGRVAAEAARAKREPFA